MEAATLVSKTSSLGEAASVRDVKPGAYPLDSVFKSGVAPCDNGREVSQSCEFLEAHANPELRTSSCRQARIERICDEELLQTRAHGLNGDLKSKKSAWPSEANSRVGRKGSAVSGNQPSLSAEGCTKCRKSPPRAAPAQIYNELQNFTETLKIEEGMDLTGQSGSEAAGAASGIWYAASNSPTLLTPTSSTPSKLDGSEAAGEMSGILFAESKSSNPTPLSPRVTISLVDGELNLPHSPSPCHQCQSPPSDLPDPDASEYNPLRPEYPPFAALPEGRLKTARRLHSEIACFVARNDSAALDSRRFRQLIVDKVRLAAQSCWENSTVEVYGSFSTNLFLPHRWDFFLILHSFIVDD